MQQTFVSQFSISSHYFKLHIEAILLAKPAYLDHGQRGTSIRVEYHPLLGGAPHAFPAQLIQEVLASHLPFVHDYRLLLVWMIPSSHTT
mgnify:CR=1 FL=1